MEMGVKCAKKCMEGKVFSTAIWQRSSWRNLDFREKKERGKRYLAIWLDKEENRDGEEKCQLLGWEGKQRRGRGWHCVQQN